MNVLTVCHAGTGVGLGHLTRSLVAARALNEELGARVHLLIQGEPVERADLGEFEHRFLPRTENLLAAIDQELRSGDARVVIFDLHSRLVPAGIGDLLRDLRRAGCKVISVDGLVDYRSDLDLLFVPSFRSAPPALPGAQGQIVSGWDCFLLNVRQRSVAWKPGNRVLVLSGGSDATGLGDVLPKLLDAALPAATELHWVTGPYARQPVPPASPRLSMLNHQAPSDLHDLMTQTTYALTVYGVSFFESLFYGIPTVVFSPYGDKDEAELNTIVEERVALRASDEVDAVVKLQELMADGTLAASLSRRARERLSVSGGHRFAQAVAQLLV